MKSFAQAAGVPRGVSNVLEDLRAVAGCGPRRRLEAIEPASGGTQPQDPRAIFEDHSDVVVAEARRTLWDVAIGDEGSLTTVESVQAALGADPQCAGPIFPDRPDVVVAETARDLRIVAVVDKGPAIWAEPVEAAEGADPQIPPAIFVDGPDLVRSPGLWDRRDRGDSG